jgi:inorganic triphosphatase YgiF
MAVNFNDPSFEIELKLVIIHNNPVEIARKINAQTHLAGYPLNRKDNVFIKDIYFDTSEKSLQQKGFALRIRVQNQQAYITIKGKTQIQEGGAIQRLEIEKEWSQQSWIEIISFLKGEKLLPESVQPLKFNDHQSALSSAGLEPIQERTTHRQIRQVTDRNKKHTRYRVHVFIGHRGRGRPFSWQTSSRMARLILSCQSIT